MATVAARQVTPSRRPEAMLLLIAVGVSVAAYAIVGVNAADGLPGNVLFYAGGTAALAFAAHLVLRRFAPYADLVLLPSVVALNGLGLAMIYRLDLASAADDAPTHFATRQLGWTVLGVVLAIAVVIMLRDHRLLRRYTYTSMVIGVALMLLPLTPLGIERNGARIWVSIFGQSFQPAEFGKIALAVFFAGYLVSNRDALNLAGAKVLGLRFPRARDLGPLVAAWAVSLAVLISQRDLGTSMLFFGLFIAMLYVATERVSWVLMGVTMFGFGAVVAGQIFSHVQRRYDAWLHALAPETYDSGASFQVVKGLFGMANGGLLGTGLGEGRPDLVPYAESDFIFAALGEELGLTGVLAILALYLIIVQRAMRTALGARDGFGKLLAAGLGFTMALQLFIVIGGVTRVIPLTGLTTPFMAYGGTSLLANWVIVALLLRMSHSARQPAEDAA